MLNPPLIVYIHGAFCDSGIFDFIRSNINVNNVAVNYNWRLDYQSAVESIIDQIPTTEKIFLVGSSLGGLYSLIISDRLKDRVVGGITISTPYGGSIGTSLIRICKFMFLGDYECIPDLNPIGELVQTVKSIDTPKNWSGIVTTAGHNPIGIIPNDGIVSLESMRARHDLPTIDMPYGHVEVMSQMETVTIIKNSYDCLLNISDV